MSAARDASGWKLISWLPSFKDQKLSIVTLAWTYAESRWFSRIGISPPVGLTTKLSNDILSPVPGLSPIVNVLPETDCLKWIEPFTVALSATVNFPSTFKSALGVACTVGTTWA